MDLEWALERLRQQGGAICTFARDVPDKQLRWRPQETAWSLLEVINHLADEELLDFRTRLEYTLVRPGREWPPIDPPAWVIEKKYNDRDAAESVSRFQNEREQTLTWLPEMKNADWTMDYEHPLIGRITAMDLLSSWVNHDLLHIRQMTKLHHLWLANQFPDASCEYAGSW